MERPNNWGAFAVSSLVAANRWINDAESNEQLCSVVGIFAGFLGDRSYWSEDFPDGFRYGEATTGDYLDCWWYPAGTSDPVPINPLGATLFIDTDWHNVDGVIVDDQRRCKGCCLPTWCDLDPTNDQASRMERSSYVV
jgi:hypothetical protein